MGEEAKLIETGTRLRERRKSLDFTMKYVAELVGVSENYISEIEKGTKGKIPSDFIIRELAKVYKFDEGELFKGFGKIPLSLREELTENERLMDTLYRIKKSKKLNDDDRNRLYDEIHKLYEKHLDEKE
jgi:transcriptional regulator with XRE-family HTH domain